jgi:hypothetical protein
LGSAEIFLAVVSKKATKLLKTVVVGMQKHRIKKGAKLSEADKAKLAEMRGKGSTTRHVASMRMLILKGHSFDEAHKAALKSVGK